MSDMRNTHVRQEIHKQIILYMSNQNNSDALKLFISTYVSAQQVIRKRISKNIFC